MSTSTYDELPYLGFPRRHAHPSVIAANARIFGIDAPPVSHSRILELGCGDGANILSIAASLPNSKCCGVDFSKIQIDRGQRAIEAAGLSNIKLIQSDFGTAQYPEEKYDYIIAHGVYSWIKESEQDRLLELVSHLLTENGSAFISYNCFPGWNLRKMTREMMLYQTRKLESPQEKVNLARQIIPGIMRSVPETNKGYASLLNDEQALVNSTGDYYIAHEHLEEDNQPCYFHEFADRISHHNLQFLCEAELSSMYLNRYPSDLYPLQQEEKGSREARIEAEQLLDYSVFRMFRQSLICKGDLELKSELTANEVCGLYASAFGDFKEQPEFTDQPESYQSAKGIGITTASPAAKAALYVLAEKWPERLSFEAIVDKALDLVESDRDSAESAVAELLLAASTTDGVELHGDEGNYTGNVSEKPTVSPLARFQAIEESSVFTLRHTSFNVDPFSRILLINLDGSRTAEDIVSLVIEAVEDESLIISEGMSFPEDEGERNKLILIQIEQALIHMANQGLFIKSE